MRVFPVSFLCFVATAVTFVLQMVPILNIFLMFALAMFWSVLLVNAGMVGTAVEALSGRVSRWWLVVPAAFYGGYFTFAVADHLALRQLGASYDAANARVSVPFDPQRQALVFENDRVEAGWFVRNYGLPVAYSRVAGSPQKFRSNRMIDSELCKEVRDKPGALTAGIQTSGFSDGTIRNSIFESRFCSLTMPDAPALPLVTVARREDKSRHASFAITRATTTIAMPDGRRFELLGGMASPLAWFPMPLMGCWPQTAKWKCEAGFWRNDFTPIVAGDTPYNRDDAVLARALGLQRVAIAERTGSDPGVVRAKMAAIENAALARQLAAIDRMIADPIAPVEDWQVGAVTSRPEILVAKADAIMSALERASAVSGSDLWKARESGRILADLVAALPRDLFAPYGLRVAALYAAHCEREPGSSFRNRSHWLWESEALKRRLDELGPAVTIQCG